MVKDHFVGLMYTLSCMPSKMEENSESVVFSVIISVSPYFNLKIFSSSLNCCLTV